MSNSITTIDLGGVNAYLLKENDNFLLADTGGHMMLDKVFDNRRTQLEYALEQAGCTPDRLKLIVLTHGDCDHVTNALYLSKKYHAPIAMSKDDLPLVQNLTLDLYQRSINYASSFMNLIAKLLHKQIVKAANATIKDLECFTPDIFLNDGDSLSCYGLQASIIALPGHTPGSIGIYTSKKDLICGDMFNNNKKPATAMNAWDFDQLKESLQKLKNYEILSYYPGHGKPFVKITY